MNSAQSLRRRPFGRRETSLPRDRRVMSPWPDGDGNIPSHPQRSNRGYLANLPSSAAPKTPAPPKYNADSSAQIVGAKWAPRFESAFLTHVEAQPGWNSRREQESPRQAAPTLLIISPTDPSKPTERSPTRGERVSGNDLIPAGGQVRRRAQVGRAGVARMCGDWQVARPSRRKTEAFGRRRAEEDVDATPKAAPSDSRAPFGRQAPGSPQGSGRQLPISRPSVKLWA